MHIIIFLFFTSFVSTQNEVGPALRLDESSYQDTIFVVNTQNEGEGSLRNAIIQANLAPDLSIVGFDLNQTSEPLILLNSPLPTLQKNLWIINSGDKIILDGSQLNSTGDHGLRIKGDSIIIRGLHLKNFPNNAIDNYNGYKELLIEENILENNGEISDSGDGIDFRFATNCILKNNQILSNKKDGIYLYACENIEISGNTIRQNLKNGINVFRGRTIKIGDTCGTCQNTIILNQENGIRVSEGSINIEVLNNYIGVIPNTLIPFSNGMNGISFMNSDSLLIGGVNAGNYISGNSRSGIYLSDSCSVVKIQNNYIGYATISGFGTPNSLFGIEVLNSKRVEIGGHTSIFANKIGFQGTNVYVGDSSINCSIRQNEFFCGINSIDIEPGSNNNVSPVENFEIISSNTVRGTASDGEEIQLYLKAPECEMCEGSLLLGKTICSGNNWEIVFNQRLHDGDVISTLKTDTLGNTSDFSNCLAFTCSIYDLEIIPNEHPYICENNTLTLSTNTGTVFSWSTGENKPQIIISSGGHYSVNVLDEKGCPAQDSIYIPTFSSPELTIFTPDSTIFCDESAIIGATGQGLFKWNTGDEGQILKVLSTGIYCVSLTDQYQCIASDCIQITRGDRVNAQIEILGNDIFCEGESTQLVAKGGNIFNWNVGGETNDTLTVFDSGDYWVTVSNEYGCLDSTNWEITVNPAPNAYIEPAGYVIICHGDSIKLTAGGGTGYYWNTGDYSKQLTVNEWGDYSVTVENQYGCTDVASQSITVKPPIIGGIINEGPIEFCQNDSTWLIVNHEKMDSMVWSTGAHTDSLLVKESGNYSIDIFNLGCVLRDSIEVIVNPTPETPDTIYGLPWSFPDSIETYSIPEDPKLSKISWQVEGGDIIDTEGYSIRIQWTADDFGEICVTYTDIYSCTSESKCKLIDLAPLSINDQLHGAFRYYPNPSSGWLTIERQNRREAEHLILEFLDPAGIIVHSESLFFNQNKVDNTIDLSGLPPGVYWLKIIDEVGRNYINKLIMSQ